MDNFHILQAAQQLQLQPEVVSVLFPKQRRDIDYRVRAHYHPYTAELVERLNTLGLNGLLDPAWQAELEQPLTALYTGGARVVGGIPKHEIDVSLDGPYAIYNWELFFHAPVLIALHLSKNQRFAEAQRWFHRVFDPTSTDTTVPVPQRFWRFLRFRQATDPVMIDEIMAALAETEDSPAKAETLKSLTLWRDRPFQPHIVARGRITAYQVNVLMKYLDNLIAWADSLFRQDTIETLNEATQLYVLAANLLGPKPQPVPEAAKRKPKTYAQLRAAGVDAFGNAMVEMENLFPYASTGTGASRGTDQPGDTGTAALFGIGRRLYFCIPANPKLLGYWDTVGDRLFKIRHCMNIEGVVRSLALFEPPIDPGVLVRAAAAGLDVAAIVGAVNTPVSSVRGSVLLAKAQDVAAQVAGLGQALLSAIEKQEAEHVALLRQQQDLAMTDLVRETRFLQWKDAEAATAALLASRRTVWERYRHYKRVLGTQDSPLEALKAVDLLRADIDEDTFDTAYAELVGRYSAELPREPYRKETTVGGLMEFAGETVTSVFGGTLGDTLPLNKNENAELNIYLPASDTFGTVSTVLRIAGPILSLIPQFGVDLTPWGVGGRTEIGGKQLSKAAEFAAGVAKDISNAFAKSADRASKLAGYYRRAEDYVLQANLATSELEQYGRQIISSLLREHIAKREYENQVAAIANAAAVEEFLRTKFTNAELYTWLRGELARTYHDAYTLAFDLAKKAEVTLQHEVMRPGFSDVPFVKFGYWDAGREGLLAGEALALDLRRLELAHLDADRREYELTKHVSLARLDPMALLRLKATGSCEVSIPEWLFDTDAPGHYLRRIKSVAVSIPCVVEPYTGVHCTLSLLRSSVRVSPVVGDAGYARAPDGTDARFRDTFGAVESIVTSTGSNDAGLFEVNLRDERHLPFEGAGAVSTWRLQLPVDLPQFDIATVSDVVLHIRYTARAAGALRAPAVTALREDVLPAPGAFLQLFTLQHEFGTEWSAFAAASSDATRRLSLSLDTGHFPYSAQRAGMADELVAAFAVIDWDKRRLSLAPTKVDLAGSAAEGWTLQVGQDSPVFGFLKKHTTDSGPLVYMTVSYAAA